MLARFSSDFVSDINCSVPFAQCSLSQLMDLLAFSTHTLRCLVLRWTFAADFSLSTVEGAILFRSKAEKSNRRYIK